MHILAGLVAVVTLSGCQKYDDGPFFSLRSREERIANTWKVDKAMNGSDNVTSAFTQYTLKMTRGRDADLKAEYSLGALTFQFETDGTWDFENNSEDLRLDFENDAADETYEILRLKEKELWLREKDGDLELQLVPA
jgi:hypothetical protein